MDDFKTTPVARDYKTLYQDSPTLAFCHFFLNKAVTCQHRTNNNLLPRHWHQTLHTTFNSSLTRPRIGIMCLFYFTDFNHTKFILWSFDWSVAYTNNNSKQHPKRQTVHTEQYGAFYYLQNHIKCSQLFPQLMNIFCHIF